VCGVGNDALNPRLLGPRNFPWVANAYRELEAGGASTSRRSWPGCSTGGRSDGLITDSSSGIEDSGDRRAAVAATRQPPRDPEGLTASGLATFCLLCSIRSLSDCELATD